MNIDLLRTICRLSILRQAKRQSRADYPTFDKWYRKTHKKVYPIIVTGMPAEEEAEIQIEA